MRPDVAMDVDILLTGNPSNRERLAQPIRRTVGAIGRMSYVGYVIEDLTEIRPSEVPLVSIKHVRCGRKPALMIECPLHIGDGKVDPSAGPETVCDPIQPADWVSDMLYDLRGDGIGEFLCRKAFRQSPSRRPNEIRFHNI